MEQNLKYLEPDPFKLLFNNYLLSACILVLIQIFSLFNSLDEIKPCFKTSASMVFIFIYIYIRLYAIMINNLFFFFSFSLLFQVY